MRSTEAFATAFTCLVAVASSFPQLEVNQSAIDLSKSQDKEGYQVSRHGRRVLGDELLTTGQCIRHLEKEKMAEKISLNSSYDKYLISYVEFRYINIKQAGTKSNLSVINGGPGYNFVDFLFSSDSEVIYLQYYVYGINNTCGTIPTKKVWEVSSAEDLQSKLEEARSKLVVMFFSVDWLVASKELEPRIEKISLDNLDVVFLQIDVDKLAELAKKYNVEAYPGFVFVKSGKVADRFEGAGGAEEKIKAIIKKQK